MYSRLNNQNHLSPSLLLMFSQSGSVSQAGFPSSNGKSSQPNNNLNGGFQFYGQPMSATTQPAASISSFYQQPQLQLNTSKATQPPSVRLSLLNGCTCCSFSTTYKRKVGDQIHNLD
ncbi:hypothetical protein HanPI659440_Chr02g0091701 [Helianthus annuus]|nr:hypothetical protein HanPI659440_Chr02g0091701 [Helianthus annuus]